MKNKFFFAAAMLLLGQAPALADDLKLSAEEIKNLISDTMEIDPSKCAENFLSGAFIHAVLEKNNKEIFLLPNLYQSLNEFGPFELLSKRQKDDQIGVEGKFISPISRSSHSLKNLDPEGADFLNKEFLEKFIKDNYLRLIKFNPLSHKENVETAEANHLHHMGALLNNLNEDTSDTGKLLDKYIKRVTDGEPYDMYSIAVDNLKPAKWVVIGFLVSYTPKQLKGKQNEETD